MIETITKTEESTTHTKSEAFQPGHIRGEDQIEALVDAFHDQLVLAMKAPGYAVRGLANQNINGKVVKLEFLVHSEGYEEAPSNNR